MREEDPRPIWSFILKQVALVFQKILKDKFSPLHKFSTTSLLLLLMAARQRRWLQGSFLHDEGGLTILWKICDGTQNTAAQLPPPTALSHIYCLMKQSLWCCTQVAIPFGVLWYICFCFIGIYNQTYIWSSHASTGQQSTKRTGKPAPTPKISPAPDALSSRTLPKWLTTVRSHLKPFSLQWFP